MSTEDSFRKATEKLDEAAGAAPTSQEVYGDDADQAESGDDDQAEPTD